MSLTVSHTHATGTLIDGTRRGDGSAEVLKAVMNPYTGRAGAWRWSRNLGSWYVARSRDTRANTALIEATQAALEAAGFAVAVEIDDTYRSVAEVEADAVARQEDRVAALGAKADRSAAAADAAGHRARELADRMPLGQPILVGHHSEARMRKAYENIENASRASVAAYEEAKNAEAKAVAASQIQGAGVTVAGPHNRLPRVKQVETHSPAKGAHRERVLAEITRLEDQIGYWKGELAKTAEAGAQMWDAATLEVGDRIRYWGGWDTVAKVNAKSVRLASRAGRLPFDRIKAVTTSDGCAVHVIDGARTVADDASAGDG